MPTLAEFLQNMTWGKSQQPTGRTAETPNPAYSMPPPTPRNYLDALVMSQVPIVSDIASGVAAMDDYRQGNKLGALLNGMGVLPFVPGVAGVVKNKSTVKIQSWPEWQKSNPGMDTNESYAAWKRAAGDAVSGEANRLSEMLRARGISATFGGGLNPANSAFPYHNAVGGVSSYMNVPGVGEVRFSDHMRGSGMGNDMTFGNADEAFSAITKLLDTKAAKQLEAARLRQDIGIADEMTRKEKMQRLQGWIAEQGFKGKDKDLYPWINKLGL